MRASKRRKSKREKKLKNHLLRKGIKHRAQKILYTIFFAFRTHTLQALRVLYFFYSPLEKESCGTYDEEMQEKSVEIFRLLI